VDLVICSSKTLIFSQFFTAWLLDFWRFASQTFLSTPRSCPATVDEAANADLHITYEMISLEVKV